MIYTLFIHSTIYGYYTVPNFFFFFFFTTNNAAMNILTLSLVYTYKRFFFKAYIQEWNCRVIHSVWVSTVIDHTRLLSQVVICINIPFSSVQGFFLLHALTKICYCQNYFFFFWFDGKVISWFHFLDDEWDWNLFLHLCFSLYELCCSLLAIFLLCWLSLSYWCVRVLFLKKIFWIKALYWLYMLPIVPHSLAYVFHILNNAFDPNCFNFNTIIFICVYIFLYRWCFWIYLRDHSLSSSHKNIHLYIFNLGL